MAQNTGGESPQWYLEVNGKKFGPYTMAQLQELARHHEILPQDKVTSSQMDGKWVPVGEVVQPAPTNSTPVSTALPSRPAVVEQPSTPPSAIADPALAHDLFNILQSARERKAAAAPHAPIGTVTATPSSSSGTGLPIFAAIAVFAILLIVGVTFFKKGSEPSMSNAPIAEEKMQPVRAAAPTVQTHPAPASLPVKQPFVAKPIIPIPTQTAAAAPPPAVRIPPHERPAGYVPTSEDIDREREAREAKENAEREAERSAWDGGRDDRDRDRIPDFEKPPAARIPSHELTGQPSQQPTSAIPGTTGGQLLDEQGQPYEQPQNARPY